MRPKPLHDANGYRIMQRKIQLLLVLEQLPPFHRAKMHRNPGTVHLIVERQQ